jgi:predicted DNA-binding protein (UPF0278 family)
VEVRNHKTLTREDGRQIAEKLLVRLKTKKQKTKQKQSNPQAESVVKNLYEKCRTVTKSGISISYNSNTEFGND